MEHNSHFGATETWFIWQVDTGRLSVTCTKLTPVWRCCTAWGHAADPGEGQAWSSLLSPCSPGWVRVAVPVLLTTGPAIPARVHRDCCCSHPEVPKCRKLNPPGDGQGQPHASCPCLVGWSSLRAFLRENKSCKKIQIHSRQ